MLPWHGTKLILQLNVNLKKSISESWSRLGVPCFCSLSLNCTPCSATLCRNVQWPRDRTRRPLPLHSGGQITASGWRVRRQEKPSSGHSSLYLSIAQELLSGLGVFVPDEIFTELEKLLVDIVIYREVSCIHYPHVHTKLRAGKRKKWGFPGILYIRGQQTSVENILGHGLCHCYSALRLSQKSHDGQHLKHK